MSRELQLRSAPRNLLILAEIKELCGPPPVLSTENVAAYYTMMLRLIESFHPEDFMERLFVKHLTDCTWEIIRFTRHKVLSIERKHREHLDRRAQRIKADAQNKQAQSADAMRAALKEIEAIMLQSPTDFDHADALERGIEYAERIDKLLNAATARRDDILQQYEQYREARRGIRLTPITGCESGPHGRRVEDYIKDHQASEPPEIPEVEALPNSEVEQVEMPPAPSNSEFKQVETPPAASDKA